jgi:hypothetical protein
MPYTTFDPFQLGTSDPSGTTSTGSVGPVWTDALMSDVALILRKQMIDDGLGTYTENWFPFLAGVPCRLEQVLTISSMKEAVQAGEEKAISEWKAYFPLNIGLREADRVQITSSYDATSLSVAFSVTQTFEVVGLDQGLTKAIRITAQLKRID